MWGLFSVPVRAELTPPTIEDCDKRVRGKPNVADSYFCYFVSIDAQGRADEAMEHLEAILTLHPERYRALLVLALIETREGHPRALEDYRKGVEGAVQAGDTEGEVYGRLGLARGLVQAGRLEEADAEREKAFQSAQASGRDDLSAWAWQAQAYRALEVADYGRSQRLYRNAEAAVFPKGPAQLQGFVLSGLGSTCWYLGQQPEAMQYFRREAEHWQRRGALWPEALALYNIALLGSELESLGQINARQAKAMEDAALIAAVRSGNKHAEAAVELMTGERCRGDEALTHFEKALRISENSGDLSSRLLAMRAIARNRFLRGPKHRAAALRLLDQAIGLAREYGSPFHLARGLTRRASLVELAGTREETVEAWLKAITAAERLRDLQPANESRTRVFSRWTYAYSRLAGYLLHHAGSAADPGPDLELAFESSERMRARGLLDALAGAGAARTPGAAGALYEQREDLLTKLSKLQTETFDSSLSAESRQSLVERIELLEAEETGLRDRIAREDPVFSGLHTPSIPTLPELRQALTPEQALVLFQLDDDRLAEGNIHSTGGGSWALLVTRERVRAFPLPPKTVIRERIEIYTGLLGRRDGSQAGVSALITRDLLGQTLDSLPASITRLVIVPDLDLHHLPFGSLARHPGEAPLAARFEISYAPSATLWLHWKQQQSVAQPRQVLALVDPEPTADPAALGREDSLPWAEGQPPGRLPHARQEGRAILRSLGGGRLLEGLEASESSLKQADPASYGVLYLATHVLTDEQCSRRSAVLLAPGAPEEDGLLQIREVVTLDLTGKVVVLAGCRSARGEILRGEGVLGLSQALFRAGTRAVVGSLAPLRDDETAQLMEFFARELSRGETLSAAFTAARRDRISAGAPVASWANLILIGDGDLLLGSPRGSFRRSWPAWLLLAAAIAACSIWLGARRRSRVRSERQQVSPGKAGGISL